MHRLRALFSLTPTARFEIRRGLALITAAALLTSACGSGVGIDLADVNTQTTERPTVAATEPTAVPALAPTATPVPEATPIPDPPDDPDENSGAGSGETALEPLPDDGRVTSIQGVALATVKIGTEGTFVPPFEIEENRLAGVGTGFIIDPSGLMVTNNHVVSGATQIDVYLDGQDTPTAARLLGVSECTDLAVLELDGDGYPYLEFRTSMDDVLPGLPVFAAGYPALFDTDILAVDYTLTGGIVNTTTASGMSAFSAVRGALEHDARIRGGNSGGPLVDEQGRVVGINYLGNDTDDLNVAIDAISARPIIDALENGDVESLGINGEVVVTEEVSGIWVSAVQPGTPADRAGLVAGDLIIEMEGEAIGADGTLEGYCELIRSEGIDATLAIEVVRLGSEEVLSGEINGEPLTQSFSFADELSDEMSDSSTSETVGEYTEYEFVSDDSDSVGVEVPVEWADRNGTANADFGESLYAAPDLDQFIETFDVPGVIVERSTDFTSADIDEVLDLWDAAATACADRGGREDFVTPDAAFTGKWEVFTGCGANNAALITIVVSPPDGNSVVRMLFQVVTEADLGAADRAIASFDAVA